ncbi:glutathione s-transferase t1 [Phtheirospermum japonicum]|uniref:glutathione transferase n=1 Tax=Phtheirospermum japonicum TaxID=374723 RepID=A0A830BI77_9LAMI|nr:glutathione s-transferase t1 [Phtheirospermum japonicum]
MELTVYVNPFSQPSRAVLIFCKANGIEFKEVTIELDKMQHRTPEYAEINPMKQIPAIVHADFKLFESHAILIYLASTFPGVADHWYPTDVRKRAKIHSVLDWHHSNLRRGSVDYLFNSGVAIAFGLPMDPKAADQGKKLLLESLAMIDSYWLQEDGPFLLGNSQPSIADLALACEVMQLEVVDEKDRDSILSSYKKIPKWVDNTKKAVAPYFDEVHSFLPVAKEMLKELISSKQ